MMATAPVLDTARPAMDPDEEAALLDAIQKWVDKEVRPVVLHHDHNDIWPAELVDQMVEMGLFGATIGQEYGGLGLARDDLCQNCRAHLLLLDGDYRYLSIPT